LRSQQGGGGTNAAPAASDQKDWVHDPQYLYKKWL
jgi:hypothetical protein